MKRYFEDYVVLLRSVRFLMTVIKEAVQRKQHVGHATGQGLAIRFDWIIIWLICILTQEMPLYGHGNSREEASQNRKYHAMSR